MKITELIPIFCDQIPECSELEEGMLYISHLHNTSIHLCACGCKKETVLPFNREEPISKSWNMINQDGKISFSPSIGNFMGETPYHAHYYITENKIIWC